MTLMIALIGEQTLPNLLPIRHYQPEAVLLVYTSRTESMSNRLQALLSKDTSVHMLETDAYDIKDVSSKLTGKLKQLGTSCLLFNLTGGTKSMMLAAYQVAQDYVAPVFYFQSEGKTNKIYYYVWENGRLVAQPDEKSKDGFPEYLTLSDFFDVQLGRKKWGIREPSKQGGGLFEIAIADVLRMHEYEVMGRVQVLGAADVDIALRYKNQVAILEAKTGGRAGSLEGPQQLSLAVKHLGTYTKQFYVVNFSPEEGQKALIQASRIEVIPLTEYQLGMESLTSTDAQKLITEIDKVMKD